MKKFEFDEKKHIYTLDGKPLMGVTSVLSVIAKPALIPWASKMATEHIEKNLKEFLSATPERQKELLDEAKKAHAQKRDKRAKEGTDLHSLIEDYVVGCINANNGFPTKPTALQAEKIQPFIDWAKDEKVRFLASEKRMYNENLWVAGTCDIVFERNGQTFIADIKTAKKIYDKTPMIQCSAYGLMYKYTEGKDIDGYCIIRIHNGDFEVLWSYDVEGDTQAFLSALQLYKHLKFNEV